MTRFLKLAAAALAAFGLLTGAASAAGHAKKIGFVYVGPVGDHGWTFRHDEGRKAVEAEFGDAVSTTFVESVSEGPDAERVIRQLAASGHDMIFTTSFGFMDSTLKVAKDFPDVKFEHATGFKRADNMATYSARFYEGRAILGHIAGKMSETNTIGYIASFPIPEVVRGINATIIAARKVNPDMKVKVIWVNTWYNPGKEADAAAALIDQGADIIMQHTDSPAPLQVAGERGVLGFGQASDMIKFAPDAQMTAIIDDWGPYYVERVGALIDGTWESKDTWDGLAPGMVGISEYTNMPADIVAEAKALQAALTAGDVHAFDGPINDQDGNEILAAGETYDDGVLATMNFYVEGVEGDLPN